ncbi:MAG TPA: DUF5668 domain-containing protein, partial [Thermoanaerobaculia bacterium]
PQPLNHTGVKLIVGLFLTALGIVLTLDNLRIIYAGHYLRYWPAVVIAIGVIRALDPKTRFGGVITIVVGALLLAFSLQVLHFSIFSLWPMLMIIGGGVIVANSLGLRSQEVTGGSSESIVAVFSNRTVTVHSNAFTGARVITAVGGCTIDLTAADIERGPAVIEAFVVVGGLVLRVPDGWEIVAEAVPVMGGIDVKTKSKHTGRQLIVRGFVMMGGIEVKDVAARTA